MRQRSTFRDDAELGAVREIAQPESSRRMLLCEIDFALTAVHRSPLPQPTLQRAQQPRRYLGEIAPLQLFQDRHRVERRRRFQQWHGIRGPPP
jgi:hypothetical protein